MFHGSGFRFEFESESESESEFKFEFEFEFELAGLDWAGCPLCFHCYFHRGTGKTF